MPANDTDEVAAVVAVLPAVVAVLAAVVAVLAAELLELDLELLLHAATTIARARTIAPAAMDLFFLGTCSLLLCWWGSGFSSGLGAGPIRAIHR
jgi:hypothetical protein